MAPVSGGTLAVDLSTRKTGWALSRPGTAPLYGLWIFPGMADLGRLYVSLRNSLEDSFSLHRPARMVFAPALFRDAQVAARALGGLMAIAELTAYDFKVRAYEIAETTARKAVLGKGNFGKRDDGGKLIRGTGTMGAKAAAIAWCESQGWAPQSDDVADSLVLLEYDRLKQAGLA